MVEEQLTPLRSEGRGANSFLVTIWPLFKPTKRPVFGCFGAIACLENHNSINVQHVKLHMHCGSLDIKTQRASCIFTYSELQIVKYYQDKM